MPGQSYIAMPSEKAARLAEDCIERILATRERKRKEYIQAALENLNAPTFWDKVFRREPKKHTEEEARKSLDGVFYHLGVDVLHGAQLEVAYCILNATKHADMVNITVSDLAKIS